MNDKIKQQIEEIGTEEMNSEGLEPLFATIREHLPKDILSSLSVGCGSGRELDYLPGEVRGIDFNPIHHGPLIDTGDMHDLPYKSNSYDLVIARDSFEHATAPLVALKEMARVSRKYVAIVLPDDAWTESQWHIIIPTMRQLMSLAEKSGLMLKYLRTIRFILNGNFLLENYLYIFKKEEL